MQQAHQQKFYQVRRQTLRVIAHFCQRYILLRECVIMFGGFGFGVYLINTTVDNHAFDIFLIH